MGFAEDSSLLAKAVECNSKEMKQAKTPPYQADGVQNYHEASHTVNKGRRLGWLQERMQKYAHATMVDSKGIYTRLGPNNGVRYQTHQMAYLHTQTNAVVTLSDCILAKRDPLQRLEEVATRNCQTHLAL